MLSQGLGGTTAPLQLAVTQPAWRSRSAPANFFCYTRRTVSDQPPPVRLTSSRLGSRKLRCTEQAKGMAFP